MRYPHGFVGAFVHLLRPIHDKDPRFLLEHPADSGCEQAPQLGQLFRFVVLLERVRVGQITHQPS